MKKLYGTDVGAEQPLVTFALFAYNQEKYIKSAVEAALAQTYTPLEIIVSDDASTDRTFEICSEVVARYTGPHTVTLNRNHQNIGLASHVNRMFEMSRGELLVMAAGDDVSLPERTSRLVQTWLLEGRPSGISSAVYVLEGDANVVDVRALSIDQQQWLRMRDCFGDKRKLAGYMAAHPINGLSGCAAAWSKDVFRLFGSLHAGAFCEDALFTLRSSLLQGVAYVHEPLVCYRHHDSNLWSRNTVGLWNAAEQWRVGEERNMTRQRQMLYLFVNMMRDVDLAEANVWISNEDAAPLRRGIQIALFETAVRCAWWSRGLLWRISHFGCTKGTLKTRLLYLLPLSVYCRVRAMAAQLRSRVTAVSKSVRSL